MDIEFYSPKSSVPGDVIRYAKGRIMCLYSLVQVISLIEVHFKETDSIENSRACMVSFVIYSTLLSVECSAGNYMVAAQKALDEIIRQAAQTMGQNKLYR